MTQEIMDQQQLLKFGNTLEMSGVLFGNPTENILLLFPETENNNLSVEQLNHEEWKELLYQLDTLGIEGLNKTFLRKSQRQIEQTVSWNVFRRDEYTCQYCGRNDVPLTVDHIVLWENMGDSVEGNLLSACKKCNKTRGSMGFPDWFLSDYLQKVITGFGHAQSDQKEKITLFYEKAKLLPLRKTQRSR